jgi:hypothetical protein
MAFTTPGRIGKSYENIMRLKKKVAPGCLARASTAKKALRQDGGRRWDAYSAAMRAG